MTDLTNLEICKRIAEIEGLKSAQVGNIECAENHYVFKDSGYGDGISSRPYNPLTDDALCFQLMVKYKVSPELFYGNWVAHIKTVGNHAIGNDKSPNKAILIAIIEAHKE